MRYRRLGNSGLKVSDLCLGTMTFGEEWGWGAAKDVSRAMYQAFREAGGNFIDTANLYTNGASERLLGDFMKGHRAEVVVATKYTNQAPGIQGPNAAGNSRKSMVEALEASLKRLQTDYVDLYWLHIWDFLTPVEEVLRGFDDLVRQGKVLYVGLSNVPAWIASRAQTIAELRGWTPFVGLQVEYSLIERTPERELIPMAEALGMTLTPWSPLAGGVLSGKYRKGDAAGARYDRDSMKQFQAGGERTEQIVDKVIAVAKEVGRSPAQVALAWLRQRPFSTVPIIGARKMDQFHDNLESLNLILDARQLRQLDEASAIEMGCPHEFFQKDGVRNFVYAGCREKIDAKLP